MKLTIFYGEAVQWQDFREISSANLIAAFLKCRNQVGWNARIAVLADINDSANVFVAERHHLFGAPVFVIGKPAQECRIRVICFPLVRYKDFRFESPDTVKMRVVRSFPSWRNQPESKHFLKSFRRTWEHELMAES